MDVRTQQLASFSKDQLIRHILLLEGEAEKLSFFSALAHFIAQHPQAQWKIFSSVYNGEERARFYKANSGDSFAQGLNAQGEILEGQLERPEEPLPQNSPAQSSTQSSPAPNSAQNSPAQNSAQDSAQNSPSQKESTHGPLESPPRGVASPQGSPREELLGGTLPRAELPRKEIPPEGLPRKEILQEEPQGKNPLDKLLQERLLHEKILRDRLLQKKALQEKLHLSQDKLLPHNIPQEKAPQELPQDKALQQEKLLQERLQHEKFLREKLLERKVQEKPTQEKSPREKPPSTRLLQEKPLIPEKSPREKLLSIRLTQEKPAQEKLVQKKSQERLLPGDSQDRLQKKSQEKLVPQKKSSQTLTKVSSPRTQGRLLQNKISSPRKMEHQLLLPQGQIEVINDKKWVYVRYAHHVTNVDITSQRDPPNWPVLKTCQKNHFWDRIYDGVFTEAGAPPGAWFNVNLHKDHIPDSSAYPTGGAVNKEYHTLVIPLESLDLLNKNMYLITINSRQRKGAACAFVTPNSEEDRWCASKMRRLDFRANDFFVFDEGWRYPSGDLPNILIVSSDPIALPKTCEWKLSRKLANF